MQNLNIDIMLMIVDHLDYKDLGNLQLAMGNYELDDVDDTTKDIYLVVNGHGITLSLNEDEHTPGTCYAMMTKNPVAAFLDGGLYPTADEVYRIFVKYGIATRILCTFTNDEGVMHMERLPEFFYQLHGLHLQNIREVHNKILLDPETFHDLDHSEWTLELKSTTRIGAKLGDLPTEVLLNISSRLDMNDSINFKLSTGCFRTTKTHIHIMDSPLHSIPIKGDNLPSGFCYLSTIEKRIETVIKYGIYPQTSMYLDILKFGGMSVDKVWFKPVCVLYGHILGHWERSSIEVYLRSKDRKVRLPLNQETLSLIKTQSWTTNIPSVTIGSTGGFDLHDLMNSQPTVIGYHCPEPDIFMSQGKRVNEPTVVLVDSEIIISSEGLTTAYNIQNKDIGKIRHDYVASRLQGGTDEPLSQLGITGAESVLTPDAINTETKKVLELGTSRSDSITSLRQEFFKKKLKYDYLLKPKECNAYYLIVGYNAIVSNLLLTQSMVDDLCARFRIGIQLETKITELLGYDLFSGYNSEDVRIAKAIFSQIHFNPEFRSEHFNAEDILDTIEAPDHSDTLHSRDIMSRCFVDSIPRKPNTRIVLDEYISKFKIGSTQTSRKRITNVPLILNTCSSERKTYMDAYNSDLPDHLKKIWMSSDQVEVETFELQKVIDEARSNTQTAEKHKWKKESIFRPELNDINKVKLALTGVGAKPLSSLPSVMKHESESKMSFHPSTEIRDIEEFIVSNSLTKGYLRTENCLIDLIEKSKGVCTLGTPQISVRIWKEILDLKLISFYDQCSEIFTELSYNYKHWTQGNQFMVKTTKSGIKMIIRNSGTHLFVSFAFPKYGSIILDTGRLGPTIYTSDNYYFTDFSSYNEPTLEHFVKSGPYMASLLIHLMSKFEMEPGSVDKNLEQHFNFISLLFLNNKTDAEELITSQRYLFMKLFEDATQDPYIFVDRLPEVLRSRLSVYILKRTILLMDYYSTNRIIKVPKAEGTNVMYNYLNIKSIINHSDVTLDQKINEFYYGYVVSKEKGRGSDRNFKIVKKILQEEYKFRDTVNNVFEDMANGIRTYSVDPGLMRVFLHIFKSTLKDKIGNNYESVIFDDFLNNLSFTNFTQLATLKASARDHSELIKIPEHIDDDRSKLLKTLNNLNKNESRKRPKVLEALMWTVKQFKEETGHEVRHMMQLIPWCLKELEKKDCFDSDIFPKPQHGGDREIHVLEIKARIVQYCVELYSKTVCKYFVSETITHPETKAQFVRQHYKTTSNTFKTSFVMSKSADASKWCQRHHVSHFASLLLSISPKIMHGYLFRTLYLWTKKKISFPLQLSATLLSNRNVRSNPTFERFRDEFYSGTGIFSQRMSNKMEIKSGMMQGILHYTSSLYHTMIQEVMRVFIIQAAQKRFNMNIVCTVVQGSDDSGMMLGVEGKITNKKISNCYVLFRMKEEISQYLSVYWNVCKSSIGTVDLIEYNSEWYSRLRSIKPTFRWISACMELSVTERFIDRIRIFNQVLTQCLEGGASTLECSVIQLNQAWLHYIMLGITSSRLNEFAADLIFDSQSPQLGFFPLDFDIACGIPGVDFQLYLLSIYGKYRIPSISDDRMLQYEYEGQDKSLVPKDLRSVKLRFGKFYLWQSLVERINLGSLEDAIDKIQKNPMIIFGRHTSWEEEVPNLLIKVFSPGVKESINNISSCLRMTAASAYILNKPCLSIYKNGEYSKTSLISALEDDINNKETWNDPKVIRSCFPMHVEYDNFVNYLTDLSNSHQTFKQVFSRSTKEEFKIFEIVRNETDLIDLCKRKWNLGGKVSLSTRQFDSVWAQTKLKFPFLEDDLKTTAENLSMTYVELKLFLESLKSKERKIVLQDSPAGYGGIESAVTRIYWPNVKIRSEIEQRQTDVSHLRSNLFSILTYWLSDVQTAKLVQETIQRSKFLSKDYTQIPVRARKLKTIYDWAIDKSKMDLIQQIKQQKQGRIGFFTRKQKGWGMNMKGQGEWRGQIIGIPCIINMMGNTTTKVTLRNLSDINVLGASLSEMLSEFKVNSPNDSVTSNLLLSSSGKITTVRHPQGTYIPIVLDPKLRVDVISAMEEMNWSLETKGTTIRLVVTDHSFRNNRQYTILSETLSQKDWNPLYTLNIADIALNMWTNNNPAPISLLEEQLDEEIPSNFSQFLKMIKHLDGVITKQGWNLAKFRSRLLSILVDPKAAQENFQLPIEQEAPLGVDAMLEIQQVMDNLSLEFSDYNFSASNLSWADEVNEFNAMDDLSGDLTDEIKASLAALSSDMEVIYENPDREVFIERNWMKMAASNRFFSNLDKLCEIQTGSRFYDIYLQAKANDSVRIKGLLGKLLSLCLKKHVYDGKDTHESLADVASASSRQVDTILSEQDLVNLDLNDLQVTITQLEEVEKALSGSAKVEVQKSLAKYRRLILLKMSPTATNDTEEIDYGFFMTKVVSSIFDNNLSKFSHHKVEDNLKLSLVKVEMIESLESQLKDSLISNHEFTIKRENINRNVVSPYLIESIRITYNININLSLYMQTFNIDDIEIIIANE